MRDFAGACRISTGTLARTYEHADPEPMNPATFVAIADGLGIRPDELDALWKAGPVGRWRVAGEEAAHHEGISYPDLLRRELEATGATTADAGKPKDDPEYDDALGEQPKPPSPPKTPKRRNRSPKHRRR